MTLLSRASAVLIAIWLPAVMHAQGGPPVIAPGDTVRLMTIDRRLATGPLLARANDTLFVRGDRVTYAVPVAALRSVEVQRGRHAGDGRFLNHVLSGAFLGIIGWVAITGVIECAGPACNSGEGPILAVYGSPIGMLIGAIIGGVHAHRNPVPRWVPAALSR